MNWSNIKELLVGKAKNPMDPGIFHKISLIALLAWVGLGADGLSSSAYGPEEAFRTLGSHTYLAIALAILMACTVFIIAIAYSRVIEHFPHGGGGYVVSSKLLGEHAGLVSGCALFVDYILTITISIAAAGDAMFSFLPMEWHQWKIFTEVFLIIFLTILNLRGVKESIIILTPIFVLFVLTHAVLILVGILVKTPALPATLATAHHEFSVDLTTIGFGGILALFLYAYSLGGGTYTGIEAVSNGLAIMREPRVKTGQRTMLYMAVSLAVTASGILFCYLLWNVTAVEGKTMNAVLVERFVQSVPLGRIFVILTLLSEGALLIVAAQAGFVDGPRVLSNMAVDSWVPRRFSALSDRLTIQNGIMLMGGSALIALLYTGGDVRHLVVMYSINVFLTFSMTEFSMCRLYFSGRKQNPGWKKKISIQIIGLGMCFTILLVTVYEKFFKGGWLTLVITFGFIILALLIRRHYRSTHNALKRLDNMLEDFPLPEKIEPVPAAVNPDKPTAVVLVRKFNGLGIHTFFSVEKLFPKIFKRYVFISVGELDTGQFKGADEVDNLRYDTKAQLEKYVEMTNAFGIYAEYRFDLAVDTIDTLSEICKGIRSDYPNSVFFMGKLVFSKGNVFTSFLHNDVALGLQNRLIFDGSQAVLIPVKVY